MAGIARSPSVLTQSTFICVSVAVRQVICSCSVVCNVGGVSVNHFLKHSNHFKQTLNMFFNGSVRFGYYLTFNLVTTALLTWRK